MELTDPRVINELLSKHGFHFSKAMGQNFLTAAWVPERIAEASGAGEGVGVLEIGPGVGCLTKKLAELADSVVAVELDKRLPPLLRETLADCPNVELVTGDALKLDLAALAREKLHCERRVVCANLPYNITSPLLTALLTAGVFESLTVMVQREVARRICSKPGTPEYGAFTLFVNWRAEPRILFDVSPDCFTPRPKVFSSVLRLEMRSSPPCEVKSEELLFRVIRASFAQRRKTLLNALSAGFPERGRAELADAIAALGMPDKLRGETLGLAEFAALADALI